MTESAQNSTLKKDKAPKRKRKKSDEFKLLLPIIYRLILIEKYRYETVVEILYDEYDFDIRNPTDEYGMDNMFRSYLYKFGDIKNLKKQYESLEAEGDKEKLAAFVERYCSSDSLPAKNDPVQHQSSTNESSVKAGEPLESQQQTISEGYHTQAEALGMSKPPTDNDYANINNVGELYNQPRRRLFDKK